MQLVESQQGAISILAASGRLDMATSDSFREALLARLAGGGQQSLVLDFSGVDYISSAGLRVLMIASKQARSAGVSVAIAGLQPIVAEIFQISRFDTLFPCHATLEAALADDPDLRSSEAPAGKQGPMDKGDGITVRFWGTRGSLPTPLDLPQLRQKLASTLVAGSGLNLDTLEKARGFVDSLPFRIGGTYGGNSSCVELSATDDNVVLLDMGSGARLAGHDALRRLAGRTGEFHILMSHVHWDHIMGFPFFAPAYVPGQRIRIYGCHEQLEHAFRRQQAEPSFPVDFSALGAQIEFVVLEPERSYEIAGYRVTARLQLHGGDSYAYRLERNGKVVVYSTDAEHKPDHAEDVRGFVDLFRNADLVIFDAMYSLADSVSIREDWGHSSNVVGVELCQQAAARRLALFHHEPVNDDAAIDRLCHEAQRLEQITRLGGRLEILAAYDGLEIDV
jgi:anti-anti-sigma factor